jgi:hypothetical protein
VTIEQRTQEDATTFQKEKRREQIAKAGRRVVILW